MPSTDPLSAAHAALAVKKTMQVRREEYLDHMIFRANRRPLLTEIFGPLVGLKQEWAAQGITRPGARPLRAAPSALEARDIARVRALLGRGEARR